MTRLERLAQTEARALARIAVEKTRLAVVQGARKAEIKKALAKRRYAVGTMADEAGLLSWIMPPLPVCLLACHLA